MSSMDVGTPRFYCDRINYLLSRGVAQDGNFDVMGVSNTIAIQTGSEAELFDMRPLNKVDFNTSAATGDHVLINIDTQNADRPVSFVAILNHNCNSANARIKIRGSDTESHVAVVDMASAQYPTIKQIVNGDAVSTSVVTPATDGSTIISWTNTGGEQTYRYWGIQFEGDSAFDGTTDLFVGCILMGEIYNMPNSPNMAVTRSISFDGLNTVQQSEGGQRYSNLRSYGRTASSTSKSPFTTSANGYQSHGGRIIYDMSFSFLSSANLMPTEYDIIPDDEDTFVGDVWNMVSGSHLPFIFSVDKDSEGDNAESEHIFARFANSSLDMTQVSHKLWDLSLSIEEEF